MTPCANADGVAFSILIVILYKSSRILYLGRKVASHYLWLLAVFARALRGERLANHREG